MDFHNYSVDMKMAWFLIVSAAIMATYYLYFMRVEKRK
jgi:hypothetical protein